MACASIPSATCAAVSRIPRLSPHSMQYQVRRLVLREVSHQPLDAVAADGLHLGVSPHRVTSTPDGMSCCFAPWLPGRYRVPAARRASFRIPIVVSKTRSYAVREALSFSLLQLSAYPELRLLLLLCMVAISNFFGTLEHTNPHICVKQMRKISKEKACPPPVVSLTLNSGSSRT